MRNISIYMAADNDLSEYAKKDILEMEKIGSSESLKAMVQVDFFGKENTFRFIIAKSHRGSEVTSTNIAPPRFEVNTGEPSALREFLKWSIDTSSINNSSIVLWGHGTGWRPPGRDVSTIPSLFSHLSILEKLLGYKLEAGKSYGVDFTDAYAALDSVQLKEIFEDIFSGYGKLEFLAFDACLMSSLAPPCRYSPCHQEET
jgi:hypothetical protein